MGDDVAAHRGIWEKAILRMHARQMPPMGEHRPGEDEYRETLAALEKFLDGVAAANPDPGSVPAIRRLTRTEYGHAIRDLLGVDIDVSERLPPDELSHGFDNITVGTLSPALLGRYINAAQTISRMATGIPGGDPEVRVVRVPADRTQEEQVEGLPPGTRGGILFRHLFPVTGEYEIEVRLARDRNEEVEGLREPHQVEILVDGDLAADFTVKPPSDGDFSKVDAHLKKRLAVQAGQRKIGVTFPRKSSSLLETRRQPYAAQFNMHRHARQAPAVYQVTVSGPHEIRPGDGSEARKRILTRMPESPEDEELLEVAERGELSRPEILAQQVRRMLADPKAAALVTNFADQWLHLRNIESLAPDARLFPDFDDNLRQAFRRETELFVASVLEADGRVADLATT